MNKDGKQKTTNLVMLLLMRIHCDILSNMWVAYMNMKKSNMKIQRDYFILEFTTTPLGCSMGIVF
jgi:hypothetical protein